MTHRLTELILGLTDSTSLLINFKQFLKIKISKVLFSSIFVIVTVLSTVHLNTFIFQKLNKEMESLVLLTSREKRSRLFLVPTFHMSSHPCYPEKIRRNYNPIIIN